MGSILFMVYAAISGHSQFTPDRSLQSELAAARWSAPGEHPLAQPNPHGTLDPYEDPALILHSLRTGADREDSARPHAGKSAAAERRRAGAHARLLAEADRTGRILDPANVCRLLTEATVTDAGGEHVVVFNRANDRYYKLTKPGQYGMQADDAEAYLERWAIANHPLGLGDDVHFEGMVLLPGEDDYRSVISQPFRQAADPTDPNASPAEVEAYLLSRGYGYHDLYWVHPLLGLQVWDFNTPENANAIRAAGSVLIYDLQIEPAPPDFLRRARAALRAQAFA
jgi:hypothetical protein